MDAQQTSTWSKSLDLLQLSHQMGNTKHSMSQSRTAGLLLWLMQGSRYLHQKGWWWFIWTVLERRNHCLAVAGSLHPLLQMDLHWSPGTEAELRALLPWETAAACSSQPWLIYECYLEEISDLAEFSIFEYRIAHPRVWSGGRIKSERNWSLHQLLMRWRLYHAEPLPEPEHL